MGGGVYPFVHSWNRIEFMCSSYSATVGFSYHCERTVGLGGSAFRNQEMYSWERKSWIREKTLVIYFMLVKHKVEVFVSIF